MLTVAVTGPTGEIGRAFIRALEREPEVERVIGMARRPFDPGAHALAKLEYRQGDILDPQAVAALVEDADVVVHLAFVIAAAGGGRGREINLRGSRNVFEAALAARPRRLVYTSSVAAYGFRPGLPERLTEDVPARGSEHHAYSAHKAAVEAELEVALAESEVESYVFRPCIVAGPEATLLLDLVPVLALAQRLPGPVRAVLEHLPALRPVLPDPGVRFQLVHHDDVAAALCAAVRGSGEPGAYNLAGPGLLRVSDVARALGWHSVGVPHLAVSATAELVARTPFLPNQAAWIEAVRQPMLMDTSRAREQLGWRPRHSAAETLAQTVAAVRARDQRAEGA